MVKIHVQDRGSEKERRDPDVIYCVWYHTDLNTQQPVKNTLLHFSKCLWGVFHFHSSYQAKLLFCVMLLTELT